MHDPNGRRSASVSASSSSPPTPANPPRNPSRLSHDHRLPWGIGTLVAAAATIAAAVLWALGILSPVASAVLLLAAIVAIYGLYEMLREARLQLRRVGRAQLLYEAGRKLSGSLVVEEIYDTLRELVRQAIPCDGMIVSSYDAAYRLVRCVYGWVPGGPFDHTKLPALPIDLERGTGMQTEVIRTGEGRLYGDVRERVRRPGARYFDVAPGGRVRDLSEPGSAPPGARCALMVPIKLEGAVVGIVQAMSDTRGAYQPEHLAILESLVTPLAVALQNAELYARAQREIAERMRIEKALIESEERLREADRRKDEFLATLAHELRNPLAPIQMAAVLLKQDDPHGSKLPWSRSVIERQVGHMARLLDDLLDVSRISRGTLRLRVQRIELGQEMRHAVQASRPLMEAGQHELVVTLPESPVWLEADPTRLAQVISNLLSNAARYSENRSRIFLTAGLEEGEVVIRVRDEGIGIPPEMLPKIFEPFLQVDRTVERSQGGLGIGLTLVKRVVESHGGRVEARSEGLGMGSEFVVRLPAPSTAPAGPVPRAAAPAPPTGSPSHARVLVADDLPDSADALGLLLRSLGHEVRVAYDGAEAVRIAEEFRPDVVLLDIGMPHVDGYEAARRIRAECANGEPVLIALTGWGNDEDRQRSREAGFDHHLVKPVDPAKLTRLITARESVSAE